MKKRLLLLIIPFMMLASCAKDTSAYLPQEKENVNVDNTTPDEDKPYEPGENELVPGLYSVTLDVVQSEKVVKRTFKYFMPVSIDPSKKISIVFEFHGNMGVSGDTDPDPISDITKNHPLNEIANRQNCIVVFPAGSVNEDRTSIGWQGSDPAIGKNYTQDLPFVDEILKWFGTKTPLYSPSHVFSTGTSSGGIFSFNIAVYRSTVFAAVAPRAAQYRGIEFIPERAVPIRVFLGIDDTTVKHPAAISNMTDFARTIGGYFDGDMVYNEKDTLEIPRYKEYLVRSWSGAKADYQTISLIDEGHGIQIHDVANLVWEFFETHNMENASTNLYITTNTLEISADGGSPCAIEIKATDEAKITFDAPSDWTPTLEGKTLKLKAPTNYNTCLNRSGIIRINASLNGNTKTKEISYKLNPPRSYFEVGDIYHNDKLEPMGVVFWVDPSDLSKAKIVCLNQSLHALGNVMKFGDYGPELITSDPDDGLANTTALMAEFERRGRDFEGEPTFSYVWCYELDGTIGWYLPAENELVALGASVDIVNKKLTTLGKDPILTTQTYISSTTILSSKGKEAFRPFDFVTKSVLTTIPKGGKGSNYNVRAVMQISK